MRVWDISPGYLNRSSLLGEHREIHAIVSILRHGKKGYSRHPETLRWQGYLTALCRRHDWVAAEITLRGYAHLSPILAGSEAVEWPPAFLDAPGAQFGILRRKYATRPPGRIPLPRSPLELWEQHRYSLLARDPDRCRGLEEFARAGSAFDDLAAELVEVLRTPPTRLSEALAIMTAAAGRACPSGLDRSVAESSALSDFKLWCGPAAFPEFPRP